MKKYLLLAIIFSAHTYAADTAPQTDHIKIAANEQAPQKNWAQLSESERAVLAPLGAEWDTLRPWQRERMLDIAKDYPKMDSNQQQLVQKRLDSWSRMTPYERENARKRFQKFESLSAEEKAKLKQKWKAYQKLSESEREKLREESGEVYSGSALNN